MVTESRSIAWWSLGSVALIVLSVMALAPSAPGGVVASFTVNSTGDEFDAGSVRNGVCDTDTMTAGDQCTLRAAIQEASDTTANPGADLIAFDPSVFTGNVATSTIVATNGVEPAINEAATIDGGDCDATAAFKPCVGFQGGSGQLGLIATGDDVEIRGLAITNAATGLTITAAADDATVAGNWFGLRLDQTAQGNGRGVELVGGPTPAGDQDIVGGETAADRNVFAHSTADGVRITGGDDNVIKGNYFGTKPDGTTAAPNGTLVGTDNIEVSSVGGTANPASGNTIGGTLSAGQLATPECDGPCNVIANSSDGIDLETEGGAEGSPVSTTTIKGNFIGLDRTGQTAAANTGQGIRASTSNAANSPLTVGGPVPGDRNVISGNAQDGVRAAGGVTVRNNYFGSNSDGDAAIPNLFADARVGTNDNPATSTLQDNRFAGNGLSGGRVFLAGGIEVIGNTFGIGTGGEVLAPASTVLTVTENFVEIGGPDPADANTIGNVANGDPAVLIAGGNQNQVRGNLIGVTDDGTAVPNTGPGIRVTNSATNTALNNKIGGDLQAEENVISNSTGDAIEIVDEDTPTDVANIGNQVLRNRGSNNGSTANDLFIDLRTDSAGDGPGNPPTGPNAGIQAPSLNEPTANQIDGAGAVVDARVRVFKTVDESVDSVLGFVNDVIDADGGTWTVLFASPLPSGQCLSATQTDAAGNTSELPAALSIGPDPCDVIPPTLTINSPAAGATTATQPTFTFSSADATDVYECRFDAAAFGPCSDSTGAAGSHTPGAPLSEGAHTFEVRGTDAVGNVGAVASRAFTVDATPPIVTINSPAPGAMTGLQPTFTFSSADAGDVYECRFDTAAFGPCTDSTGATGSHTPGAPLSAGAHTFEVRATDAVGNTGAVASRSFTAASPPTVNPPATNPPAATGLRAAALKKCKKKKRKARRKCRKRAKRLPL